MSATEFDSTSGYMTEEVWRLPIRMGEAFLGTTDQSAWQFLEVDAIVPENLYDDSIVKVQATFGVQVAEGVFAAGDIIESWATWTYDDVNYSLQCVNFAGEEFTDVSNFIGTGSMLDADNQDKASYWAVNEADYVTPHYPQHDSTTDFRRLRREGKPQGGKAQTKRFGERKAEKKAMRRAEHEKKIRSRRHL